MPTAPNAKERRVSDLAVPFCESLQIGSCTVPVRELSLAALHRLG